MEIVCLHSGVGELRHITHSVWKEDANTYHIILENPQSGTFVVVTVDVRSLVREAVLVN